MNECRVAIVEDDDPPPGMHAHEAVSLFHARGFVCAFSGAMEAATFTVTTNADAGLGIDLHDDGMTPALRTYGLMA
jgi:hypothetical protein